MALTDFDYIATRNDIIESAFRIVGALEAGQPLSAAKMQAGVEALQMLVKSWITKHLFLWSFTRSEFPTVAAQEAYTVYARAEDAAMIGIDQAFIEQDSGNDVLELEVISWRRYEQITNKESSTGRPSVIAFKPTPNPSIHVWPSPDAVYTILFEGIFPLQDFDTASGTGSIPAYFQRALKYGLASDLHDEYPESSEKMRRTEEKAAIAFEECRQFDTARETTSEVEGLYRNRR